MTQMYEVSGPAKAYHISAALKAEQLKAEVYIVLPEKFADFITNPDHHIYWISLRSANGTILESGTVEHFLNQLDL